MGVLRELPVMRIGRTRSQRLEYLLPDEAQDLLDVALCAYPHMFGFCLFGLYSGGRPGEIWRSRVLRRRARHGR